MFTTTDGLNCKHLRHTICMPGHVCIPVSTERPLASSATAATTNAPRPEPTRPCPPPDTVSLSGSHQFLPQGDPVQLSKQFECLQDLGKFWGAFGEKSGDFVSLFSFPCLYSRCKSECIGPAMHLGTLYSPEGLLGIVRKSQTHLTVPGKLCFFLAVIQKTEQEEPWDLVFIFFFLFCFVFSKAKPQHNAEEGH